MEVVANIIVVIILFDLLMYQINRLYTLNLYNGISQLHLNKAGNKKKEIEDCQHLRKFLSDFFFFKLYENTEKHKTHTFILTCHYHQGQKV